MGYITTPMEESILVRAWSAEEFHRKVLELEAQGYQARRETYKVIAEINPETSEVIHCHTMELHLPSSESSEDKAPQ